MLLINRAIADEIGKALYKAGFNISNAVLYFDEDDLLTVEEFEIGLDFLRDMILEEHENLVEEY